jgi:uncharacterized protein
MRASNRLWPVPREPWILYQEWHDLLFAHWPIPLDSLRPLIPPTLGIETCEGHAWISVVPFTLRGFRPRGLPPLPLISTFHENNVRTYVTLDGKPGVFFFSLDAQNRSAVFGARLAYRLPYFLSQFRVAHGPDGVSYRSVRIDKRGAPATFEARYRPVGPVFNAEPGTLDFFLAERYCLYATGSGGRVWRAEIDHDPWPLQPAEAEFTANTMTEAAGIVLPDIRPVLQFSKALRIQTWRPVRIR